MDNEEIMISIIDFVEDYKNCKTDSERQEKINSVIKQDAVTRHSSKIAVSDMILSMSHIDENGNFYINTALENQKYTFALISFYTYLRKTEEMTDDDAFDYLNYYDILDLLIDSIKVKNSRDIEKFNEVFGLLKEDFLTMHTGKLLTINSIQQAIEFGIINAVFRILKSLPDESRENLSTIINEQHK